MTFSENLKIFRKANGLTQTDVAKKIGVSQVAVGTYEKGTKKPEMDKLPALAKLLGVSLDELFGIKPVKEKKQVPHKNKRSAQIQGLFEKLPVDQQRALLNMIKAAAPK